MDILIVTDCHGKLHESRLHETLNGRKPDVIFYLGDNTANDIECVQDNLTGVPAFGLLGNHDYLEVLKEHGIEDLHGRVVEFNGYRIGGFGGSIRYKDDSTKLMFSDEECISVMEQMPACDILITHDKPREKELQSNSFNEKQGFLCKILSLFSQKSQKTKEPEETEDQPYISLNAHSGLVGIRQYIDKNQPRYHFHGHLHDEFTKMYGNTTSRCFYELKYITI